MNPRYEKEPDLLLRAVPEQGYLLVFSEAQPTIRWLNRTAWVLFELCDGRSEAEVLAVCRELVSHPDDVLRACLDALVRQRIVRRVEAEPLSLEEGSVNSKSGGREP